MSRPIPILIVLVLMVSTSPSVSADVTHQETHYVASNAPITVTCSPESHPIVPVGEPDPEDPTWVFSGEPECAGADVQNRVREAQGQERAWHGYGVARHLFDGADDGSVATATTEDATFGSGDSYLIVSATDPNTGATEVSEGCGPQSIVLPMMIRLPWDGAPPTYWWAHIKSVGVTDMLDVCFASTGSLHATWGA